MDIIPSNYINVLKNMIISRFSNNLKEELNKSDSNPTVFNYINLLSSLDKSLCNIAKESLVTIFEALDKGYRESADRKKKYHIKAHHIRSLMTIFGEITFKRTFYSDKYNKLTKDDKLKNKEISKKRIVIENVNAIIKLFKIMTVKYRNRRKRHHLRMSLICGIYNYEL